MSKKTNTQFQQNVDIIKGFFKKPIVLIAGIFTIIASISNSVVEYLADFTIAEFLENQIVGIHPSQELGIEINSPSIFSLDLLTISLGLSFILMFSFGRSKGNGIQVGSTYFKVISTIQYVLYFIVAVSLVLIGIFAFSFNIDNLVKIIVIISSLVAGIYTLLYGYSLCQFAKSIKASMNSIYLSDKGAKLHGVMNIISSAVMSIAVAIFLICINLWGGFNSTAAMIGSVVPTALMIINSILWAVVSLGYHRYIKGVSSGKIEILAETKKEKKEMLCNHCGCPLTEEDVFCSVCGNKVQ